VTLENDDSAPLPRSAATIVGGAQKLKSRRPAWLLGSWSFLSDAGEYRQSHRSDGRAEVDQWPERVLGDVRVNSRQAVVLPDAVVS